MADTNSPPNPLSYVDRDDGGMVTIDPAWLASLLSTGGNASSGAAPVGVIIRVTDKTSSAIPINTLPVFIMFSCVLLVCIDR